MRKIIVPLAGIALATLLINCTASKKAANKKDAITYDGRVKSLIETKCSPCHFPEKGGKKKVYDNLAAVKQDIDDIIRRVSLNPSERGFMPFRNPKLDDTSIALLKQWKEEGLQ